MTSPLSPLPSRRPTRSGFRKPAADFSGNESAGTCTTWPVLGCLGDRPRYKAGGRRVGSLGEADGQTALLAQGSCGHTGLWDRADSGSLGSGMAWFLAGSSVLLRPLLLLALWAVLPFLGPSGTYIPGPRTKCQSTVHPQGHFQILPEPKAQEREALAQGPWSRICRIPCS